MIKSSDREVRQLIDALGADPARREAAVARLIIIGERAVARLITAFDAAADRTTRIAILRVLESTADDRVLPLARRAVTAGSDLAVESVAVLQGLIDRGSLPVQAEALDVLVAVAADDSAERRVRLAAGAAVEEVSRAIGGAPARTGPAAISSDEAVWEDAAEGHLPDDPETLRAAARAHAERAPLPTVHRVIECVRGRERATLSAGGERNARGVGRQWRSVRGELHQTLARRGSRIALYDLRETLAESTEPEPLSFLAAIQMVGDASCLEPLAAAFARSAHASSPWRHHLAATFHAVARRERLNRRHSAMRRALARSPELAG